MIALVLVAGAIGALLRDEAIALVHRRLRRPALRAVATVNVAGAFLLGVVVGADIAGPALAVVGTGLLGSFTTYSTWMVESVLAGRSRGSLNLALQLLAGGLAVTAGLSLGRVLGPV